MLLVGHSGAGKTTLLEAMLFASGAHHPDGQGRGRQHRRRTTTPRRSGGASASRWRWRRSNGAASRSTSSTRPGTPTSSATSGRAIAGRRRVRVRRLGRRRRRGPDRGGLGAGGRGRPPARGLDQQARPRARLVRADARRARAGVRHAGRARSSSPSARSTTSAASSTCWAQGVPVRRRRRPRAPRASGPTTSRRKAEPFREKLVEAVAEADDALLEKYLEDGRAVRGRDRPRREARVSRERQVRAGPGARRPPRPIGVDRVLHVHRRRVPLPARPRRPSRVVTKDGAEKERAVRPRRAAHRAACSRPCPTRSSGASTCSGCSRGRLRPDSSRVQRDEGHRGARRPAVRACGARTTRRVAEVPAGDIGAVAKLAHTDHRRHVLDQGRPRDAAADRAARTAARDRHRAEDQGRRGQALDRASARCARTTRRSASSARTRRTRRCCTGWARPTSTR